MFSLHYSGTKAILLRFEQKISKQINQTVLALSNRIEKARRKNEIYGIEELVSAYASLLIYFNPNLISIASLTNFLEKIKDEISITENTKALCIEIPLCYDDSFALDLDFVCSHNNISKKELIQRHTQPYYRVFMLGFMAGFAYLGGLDAKLFTPRLSTPRTKIEAGSVGIADMQTGIYPISSPGGWQIIARSPLTFFDKDNELEPTLLKAGMFLKFKAIDKDEFYDIKERVSNKSYKRKIYEYQDN